LLDAYSGPLKDELVVPIKKADSLTDPEREELAEKIIARNKLIAPKNREVDSIVDEWRCELSRIVGKPIADILRREGEVDFWDLLETADAYFATWKVEHKPAHYERDQDFQCKDSKLTLYLLRILDRLAGPD
jgi:hypothetical protein